MTFPKSILRLFSEKQREIIRYWLKSIPAFFYQTNLSKLAQFYGTDKYEHGYTEIYSRYFDSIRHKKLRILEIGIGGGENIKYGGNSLKMWAKYFPKSDILGIDLYDKSLLDYRRIKTYQGNQTDEEFLSQFTNLDIIIDDGSHINSDVIRSFEILFPRLKVGGYYCIEDTQVSGQDEFHNSNFPETKEYFKSLVLINAEMVWHENLVVVKKF
jgi:tRNA G46 methylase TrmB